MTLTTLASVLFLVNMGINAAVGEEDLLLQRHMSLFEEWMTKHSKFYSSPQKQTERFAIWRQNNEFIENHNYQDPQPNYLLGHNQFSDLTLEEYRKYNFLGTYSAGPLSSKSKKMKSEQEPKIHIIQDVETEPLEKKKYKNWVEKGAVTPIKNQGSCGSCWAFSAVGAIEGAHFIQTKQLFNLSVQELLDCDWADLACMGGFMDKAFKFDEHSGGLCTYEDYPYEARRHWLRGCDSKKGRCAPIPETEVGSFEDIEHSHDALHTAINIQPVSVAIEADMDGFRFYKEGIYDDEECGTNLDHGVLAVGYGTENGAGYYLVKNSWGADWGDEGYIKISVASVNGDDEGQCGILMSASRPILKTTYEQAEISIE